MTGQDCQSAQDCSAETVAVAVTVCVAGGKLVFVGVDELSRLDSAPMI
jgi:hypothetical protein